VLFSVFEWSGSVSEGFASGLSFSDKTYSLSSSQDNQNGGLIEAGIDYSVAKIEGTTVKYCLRGGAELWGGDKGINWRASGGLTFQF